ncbi:MAG: oligoribonuclease [Fibrobacter sp.]|jgi:oligoribonuclease|nr:oligoribonuclease [Fibrobacter sp.]
MTKKKSSHNLVWMDLEMSGLEPEKDVILEIATIVTNAELEILAEGPVIAIHQPENVFEGMDEWNTRHHNQSGLVERCRHSQYSLADAELETLRFIKPFTEKGKNVLCGNSITQDRRFLYKYMPEISEWLCYRNIDVSSIKELTYRWYPKLEEFQKEKRHEALNDIRESIAELAYYRKTIFK